LKNTKIQHEIFEDFGKIWKISEIGKTHSLPPLQPTLLAFDF